jgi:phosphopantothenoylcysteine synthetase/decarboxylase
VDVLLTAGATRNPIDAIRVLTANATGRTSVDVAARLAAAGARVHLLGSPEAALRAEAAGLPAEVYGSTRDLMARMEAWVRAHPDGALIHAAAVGDYESADGVATKLPSGRAELVLWLVPGPKIADHVRGWGLRGPYVTFKAASPETTDLDLVAIARAQRARTGCDLVFANVLGRLDRGVYLVGDEAVRHERRDAAIAALVAGVLAAR